MIITLRSERYRNTRVTPRNAGGGVLRGAPYVVGPRNTLRKRYVTPPRQWSARTRYVDLLARRPDLAGLPLFGVILGTSAMWSA